MTQPQHQSSIYTIVTIITEDDETEREFLVNYSHYETKLWLTRTIVWCVLNQRTLQIELATEEDIRSRKQFIPTSKEEVA